MLASVPSLFCILEMQEKHEIPHVNMGDSERMLFWDMIPKVASFHMPFPKNVLRGGGYFKVPLKWVIISGNSLLTVLS